MIVRDIMTKELVTIEKDDTVETCAKLLNENNFSGLPVVENEEIVGIVTEGDLIRRVSKLPSPPYLEILGGRIFLESERKYIESLRKSVGSKVEDIMSTSLVTIYETEDIHDAATLMVNMKVKRLPVLSTEGKLIGIISRKDIMKHLFGEK